MKPTGSAIILLATAVVYFIITASNAYSFDDQETHPDLTERAIINSSFNSYLVNTLGITEGVEKKFKGISLFSSNKSVMEWMKKGSTDEDDPPCRASNHFHNPRLPWDQSYNTDAPEYISFWCHNVPPTWPLFSNITWATGLTQKSQTTPDTRDRQDMGWENARTYFHQALTSNTEAGREDKFIKTFNAVGQVMHLLEDMAVPAHVRNDFQSHLVFMGIKLDAKFTDWWANPFEYYVKNHPTLITAADPAGPTFTNPRLTDFWDTTDTAGDSPGAGLAEIVNRGYLSDQTIPGNNDVISDPYYNVHMFPLPQLVTGISESIDYLPNAKEPTRYLSRQVCPSCDGRIDHFVAYSLFTSEAERKAQTPNPKLRLYYLDDNVHKTYAGELLLLAVGYSAALLDYFFRGTINLTPVADGVTFRTVKVTAQNNTPGEAMGTGEAKLVIRYKPLAETDLGGGKYLLSYATEGTSPSDYSYKVSKSLSVNLTDPQELTFDFSDNPLPYNFDDITMQLVFKGKLGNEEGAVAVSRLEPIDSIYTDIGLSLPSSGVYAKTTATTFNELRVTAQADIPGGLTGGEIKLALEYREAVSDPFQSAPVASAPVDAAEYIIRVPEKNSVSTLPQGAPVELVFDLSTVQLPVYATDVYVNILYADSGTEKLHAIGFLDISEPTPVDFFNNTDFVCLGGQWYQAGTNDALVAADNAGNHNHIYDDDIDTYEHDFTNIHEKNSPTGSPVNASASTFDFLELGPIPPATLKRMGYILTDYSFQYSFLANWVHTDPKDVHWGWTETANLFSGTAVINQTDSNGDHYYPRMYNMRGKLMWGSTGVIYEKYLPANFNCDYVALPAVP